MNPESFITELSTFFGCPLRQEYQKFIWERIKDWNNEKFDWVLEFLKIKMPYNWGIKIDTVLSAGEKYEEMFELRKIEEKRWETRKGEMKKLTEKDYLAGIKAIREIKIILGMDPNA